MIAARKRTPTKANVPGNSPGRFVYTDGADLTEIIQGTISWEQVGRERLRRSEPVSCVPRSVVSAKGDGRDKGDERLHSIERLDDARIHRRAEGVGQRASDARHSLSNSSTVLPVSVFHTPTSYLPFRIIEFSLVTSCGSYLSVTNARNAAVVR